MDWASRHPIETLRALRINLPCPYYGRRDVWFAAASNSHMREATGLTELQDNFYQVPSQVTGVSKLADGEEIVPMILRLSIDNGGIGGSLESELADYFETEDVIMEDTSEDWETSGDRSTTSSVGNILSSDMCTSSDSEEDDTIDPDVRLARANTLAILTGESTPPPNRDFSEYDPILQRAFNLFREIDDLREQTLGHMRELERKYIASLRRDAPLRYRNLAMFLHCNLWTRSPEPESAVLEHWGPKQQALLLEVEDEFGKVGRVRNLNACTKEEFEDVLSRMAERRFVDVIWVADQEEYFPMRVPEPDLRAAVEVTLM